MSSAENARARRVFVVQDPEPFYKAQQRNRRATWRMSCMCLVAAGLMGIPLNLVLTPVFYAVILVLAEIVNVVFPLPPAFWHQMETWGQLFSNFAEFLGRKGHVDLQPVVWPLILALIPGIVITLVLWIWVLAVFRRGGVGGALMSIKARAPKQDDLKELQLANVVHEMAIAAGLPSPRVMLMDSPGANAAAIGTSPSDACVVVSRRLLDELNRDQIEGVLGQLIGSIGNGDLRIAFMVTSVFATCGLILTLLYAPFGRESRGLLLRILRYSFDRSRSQAEQAEEADVIASRLARNLGAEEEENDLDRDLAKMGASGKFLNIVFLPLIVTGMVSRFMMFIFLSMLLGPCMSLLWRTRRYLADAGAVELTHNPDGLASALEHLSETNPAIPGGAWASHLFVVDPRGDLSLESSPQARERRAAMAWKASQGGDPDAADPGTVVELNEADMTAYRAEIERLKSAAMRGNLNAAYRLSRFGRVISRQEPDPRMQKTGWQAASNTSFHPPLKRRLKRLRRMGAHVVADRSHGPRQKPRFGEMVVGWLLLLLLVPLGLLAAYFLLIAIFLMIIVNAGLMALWMMGIYTVFSLLTHH